MIDAGKLKQLSELTDAIFKRQDVLDEEAKALKEMARKGLWDADRYARLEKALADLDRDMARLQSDLDRLIAEDGDE